MCRRVLCLGAVCREVRARGALCKDKFLRLQNESKRKSMGGGCGWKKNERGVVWKEEHCASVNTAFIDSVNPPQPCARLQRPRRRNVTPGVLQPRLVC